MRYALAVRTCTALVLGGLFPLPAAAQARFETAVFGGLRARAIGPAVMSGRIAALDAVARRDQPLLIYVGSAGGGVWKSRDGGTSFQPVFDEHPQSIGALAIDPSNPKVVWVGTGESWTRNSVSVGGGVYKTEDGGDTWRAMGLRDSERIARMAVDPASSQTVWVCATGHLWDPHPERGVYKTTDGGKTWQRVLYVDEDTGCSDLALDPQDARVVYAGMWQFRRWPWFFRSGGPGSGLYRSMDGGATWRKLTRGLPEGEKGRIAVAVAPSRPSVVYALVEARNTALYRSDDLGESWQEVNSSSNIQARPFYFGQVVVDPTDHRRVYRPALWLTVSADGGKSFTSPFTGGVSGRVHADHHALWINPQNPQELLLGTDGGVYVSQDRGVAWRLVRDLPVSQFYEVSYDLGWPYNVYGGLQDNGTWMGPSRAVGGVQNRHWKNIGFGDGFHAFVDPDDPDYIYVEWQGGSLLRHRRSTGEVKDIRPYAGAGEARLRFNWNTPLHVSPNRRGTLYAGAQYLLRSRDRGESWERISPDLTTNDLAKQRQAESGGLTPDNSTAENHTTIYTISESPRNPDVIWIGTDDGRLQLTRNGGRSWNNVAANVPGVPHGTWVSHVEAGRHADGVAYVTFDGHQTGDMKPYAYRTRDFGRTFEPLADAGVEGYAHVIKEDLESPDLLFLGTELGLYLSIDGGGSWARFAGDLPRVAVRDLAIHPREHDLIIATHGRGIYILDDITPLRHLTPAVLNADLVLLPSRPAVMPLASGVQEFPGDDEFVGRNPSEAASIVYYQKARHLFGDLKVEVYDSTGALVSTMAGGKLRGLNRVELPMRLPPPKMPPATTLARALVGPRVPEGTYTFKLIKGKAVYEGKLTLVPDPRSSHTAEERRLQQQTAMELYRLLGRLTYLVDAATELRDQARQRAQSRAAGGLARRLSAYADELEAFRKSVVSSKEGAIAREEKLREELGNLFGAVSGYDGRPTDSQLLRKDVLAGQLEEAAGRFAALAGQKLDALNASLAARQLEALRLLTREEWARKDQAATTDGAATHSSSSFPAVLRASSSRWASAASASGSTRSMRTRTSPASSQPKRSRARSSNSARSRR